MMSSVWAITSEHPTLNPTPVGIPDAVFTAVRNVVVSSAPFSRASSSVHESSTRNSSPPHRNT